MEQQKRDIAKTMLQSNIEVEVIMDATGLTKEEIGEL